MLFSIPPEKVHIWIVKLQCAKNLISHYQSILSKDEQEKATRFRLHKHKRRFIIRRAVYRKILSQYSGVPSSKINFQYNEYNKPKLINSKFEHNASHSNELAIFAIANGHKIGVDIEYIRPMDNFLQLAESFFSTKEIENLEKLPESCITEAFYNIWTKKEAYIKACGRGLSIPLNRFTVQCNQESSKIYSNGKKWLVKELYIDAEYKSAIVSECPLSIEKIHWGI